MDAEIRLNEEEHVGVTDPSILEQEQLQHHQHHLQQQQQQQHHHTQQHPHEQLVDQEDTYRPSSDPVDAHDSISDLPRTPLYDVRLNLSLPEIANPGEERLHALAQHVLDASDAHPSTHDDEHMTMEQTLEEQHQQQQHEHEQHASDLLELAHSAGLGAGGIDYTNTFGGGFSGLLEAQDQARRAEDAQRSGGGNGRGVGGGRGGGGSGSGGELELDVHGYPSDHHQSLEGSLYDQEGGGGRGQTDEDGYAIGGDHHHHHGHHGHHSHHDDGNGHDMYGQDQQPLQNQDHHHQDHHHQHQQQHQGGGGGGPFGNGVDKISSRKRKRKEVIDGEEDLDAKKLVHVGNTGPFL